MRTVPARRRRGPRDRLDEVPVHGVPVDRGTLRPVAHVGPLRDPGGDDPREVERLPDRDLRAARCRAARAGSPRAAGGPRLGQRRAVRAGSRPSRARASGPSGPRSRRPAATAAGPSAGCASTAEHELAVVLDQARRRPTAAVAACARPRTRTGSARPTGPLQRLAGVAHRRVQRVGDDRGPASARLASRSSRSSNADELRDLVQVGEQQPVGVPPRDHLERVAHVEQVRVGRVDRAVRPVGEPGRGQRREHDGVADPAARLLEVGLDAGTRARRAARPARGSRTSSSGRRRRAADRQSVRTRRRGTVHDERVTRDRPHVEPARPPPAGPWTRPAGTGTATAPQWSRSTPASHSGYHRRSASAASSSAEWLRPSCTSTRSRSLAGPTSPRPRLPTAAEGDARRCRRAGRGLLPERRSRSVTRRADRRSAGPRPSGPARLRSRATASSSARRPRTPVGTGPPPSSDLRESLRALRRSSRPRPRPLHR